MYIRPCKGGTMSNDGGPIRCTFVPVRGVLCLMMAVLLDVHSPL